MPLEGGRNGLAAAYDDRPMKSALSIALVSRSNAAGGGASRIAEELGEWFRSGGSQVVHYCASPVGQLKPFQKPLYPPGLSGKLARTGNRLTRLFGLKELIPFEFYLTLKRALGGFDVVHFHDLNLALSPLTMPLCSRENAVVLTAHDCSCFTGGCLYPLRCNRYLAGCGECPQLSSIGARLDFTKINLGINRWLARQRGVQYVFPSQWLRETASRSLQFAKTAVVIPNGFSSARYDLRSKSDARRKLGIRDEQKVVLVAAHYLADPRKGVALALSAIHAIADLAPLVIFVGIPPDDLEVRLPGIRFWMTGFVRDRCKLGLLFAAADVFLFTSLEDNLPIMVQEALAAGTPVVGFAAGGVPEMVDHERTGWLCPPGDQIALTRNLRNALTRDDLAEFGRTAQETMSQRFNVDLFGQRHLELYQEALN